MNDHQNKRLVLVTGATGYVGGRLVPRLLEADYRVRVLIRGNANRLQGRDWYQDVDIAVGDVLNPPSLLAALEDVDTAYYLIHSMGGNGKFSRRDIQAAENFSHAAATSPKQQLKPGYNELSIWEDWVTRILPFPNIWNPGKKPAKRYERMAFL